MEELTGKSHGCCTASWKRIFFVLCFLVLTAISLMVGADSSVNIKSLFQMDTEAWHIFLVSRMPRTIAVILTAAGLSVSGLIMQAVSSNKFLSPSTSGTGEAAMLGVLFCNMALGNQPYPVQMFFAFVLAFASMILFMAVLNRAQFRDIVFVPLIGMVYGTVITVLSTAAAYHTNTLQTMARIKVGTFNRFTSFDLLWMVLLPLVMAVVYAARFSIAGMGENFSKGLGINYKRVVLAGLAIIASISAVTCVTVGPIPFVGLIIPNIAAGIRGDNVKRSMCDVVLLGSIFVLLGDIFCRLAIYPYELPASFVIGISGGFIFIILLLRRVRYGK